MLNKKFLKHFGNENSASRYFLPEIWKQIKPLFSDCCGMGRKIVGLRDSNGNKITIKKFPFTFNGTTYATKELFEQAVSEDYGAGYSVNLIDCCHLMVLWTRGLDEVTDYIQEGAVVPSYNFDITMDWSILLDSTGNPYPVTDQATFTQWLIDGMDGQNAVQNDFTNIIIADFVMVGNNIKCNLTADAFTFTLIQCDVTNINKIGNINGLQQINIGFNPNINISNSLIFPSSLIGIELNNNLFDNSKYVGLEAWANAQPAFTSTCTIFFAGNTNSISGTNLETILISKNCLVLS